MPRRWTEEFLDRSKKALLKIRITFLHGLHVSRWLNSMDKVMQHIECIQEFSLHLPSNVHGDKILSKLSSRAPHLENLEILLWGYSFVQSSVLFDGDTPALRTLELSYCAVPLNSLKPSLTILTLCYVPPLLQQNIEELLATLSCMQDLAHLQLDNALPHAVGFLSSAAFNTLHKFTLPRLSRLLIAAPLSTIVAFLSCVNIPSNAELRLECHSKLDPSIDDYSLLSSILGQRFNVAEYQELSSQAIRTLVIHSTTQVAKFTFSASERDFDSCDSNSRAEWGCNIPLQITFEALMVDKDHIINDICCSIPLTYLQSLRVFQPTTSSAFWIRTFGHLQHLRYMRLSQCDMPELVSLFYSDCTENHDERAPNQIFAPGLEELELEDIMFAADPPECDTTGALGADLHSLRRAPSTRERVRLTMTGCFEAADYTDNGSCCSEPHSDYD